MASIVSQLFDAVSGLFLEALGTDMTAMEEYFPFVTKAYDVMQVTAWAILILITIWQLFRAFGGPITEAENPWHLLVRSSVYGLLIGYAKPIFSLCLNIARAPYTTLMELSMTAEDFRTTFLMFSFFMMIAPFKNTLLFSDAGIPPAPSCICVSVDAFIIRRAAFPSMPKTAKPYTDLTSVLVQFVSLCVICRIYSYFMHLRSIYSGHMQPARRHVRTTAHGKNSHRKNKTPGTLL